MVTTYAGFHLAIVCCHFNHYTRAHNAEKTLCNKISGVKCMLAKFMKLKLIKHYAHVILVTPKYSQSMVFNVFM